MNNVAELRGQFQAKMKEVDEAMKAENVEEADKFSLEAERIKTQIAIAERNKELQTYSTELDKMSDDVADSVAARNGGERPTHFSLRKVVFSETQPHTRKDAEFELTVIEESGLAARNGGIPIPMKFMNSPVFGRRKFDPRTGRIEDTSKELRDITASGTNAVATEIAVEQYAKWLMDAAPIMEYVTTIPGLSGNFDLPIVSTKTPNVMADAEGDNPTAGDPTFGKMSLTPHQIHGMVKFTNQSLIQTEGFVESALRENLGDSVADTLHGYILAGTGLTDFPRGVRATANVNAKTYTAANLGRWNELAAARWDVDDANILRIRRAYFCNSSILKAAEMTDRSAGSGNFVYANGMIGQDPAFPFWSSSCK